jgi:1-acyl-sn-glycerol-3-phosphate acyltransferase
MFKLFCKLVFEWILGWRVTGYDSLDTKKCVIVVAPHTSYWDFPIGIATRPLSGVKTSFLIKKELFKNPIMAWALSNMGGIPVDRSKRHGNTVTQAIALFNSRDEMALTIAPEGTRSAVKEWKKGFYRIAVGANVPIVLVTFDYKNKEVRFMERFDPTDDIEADIAFIKSRYAGIEGKYPELGRH